MIIVLLVFVVLVNNNRTRILFDVTLVSNMLDEKSNIFPIIPLFQFQILILH